MKFAKVLAYLLLSTTLFIPSSYGFNAKTGHKNTNPPILIKKYKQVMALAFNYGSDKNQFGITRVAGGSGVRSFTTDDDNNIYILDNVNHRIQILDANGKHSAVINRRDIPNAKISAMTDMAVDHSNNMYILGSLKPAVCSLYHINLKGKLLGKIGIPQTSNLQCMKYMYFQNKNIFILNCSQESFAVGFINGKLRPLYSGEKYLEMLAERKVDAAPAVKTRRKKISHTALFIESLKPRQMKSSIINGIIGASGKIYKIRATNPSTPEEKEIFISDPSGPASNVLLKIPNLKSLSFLDEDLNKNIYLQVEKSGPGAKVKLEVYKLNPAGTILDIISIKNNDYSISTAKLLHVNPQTGDIWQVLPSKDKLYVNKWSIIY